jgi:hypothetical protein
LERFDWRPRFAEIVDALLKLSRHIQSEIDAGSRIKRSGIGRKSLALDIEIFGQLLPGQPRRRTLEMPEPPTVREVARAIGLNLSDIGLMSIDGVQSELDDPVRPDSRICFFPYLAGG